MRGPLGDKVIPGGIYGSRLIAHIVVSKYRMGVSLHRIREDLQRMGFDMPSASISDQVLWATDLLEPIWRALLDEVVRSSVMQLDGTGMPVHHKEKGNKQVVHRGADYKRSSSCKHQPSRLHLTQGLFWSERRGPPLSSTKACFCST